jgi:hypothetical protein
MKMEIPKEINISEIKRTVMREIDLSRDIRYSALINGERVMYATDGVFKKHLDVSQWIHTAIMFYIERYNQLHEANK